MSSDIPTLLKNCKNKIIITKLKEDKTIRGCLLDFDSLMNMTLDDAEDISSIPVKKLGKILLRGNNVIAVSLLEE